MDYGVYGDLIIIYPKPYSIYLRGTIGVEGLGFNGHLSTKDRFFGFHASFRDGKV